MTMYAVWSFNDTPFNFGVRAFDGSRWYDITANLHDFYSDRNARFGPMVPQDIIVVDRHPVMLMYDANLRFGEGNVFVVRYDGRKWVKTWTTTTQGQVSGFIQHGGDIYAYGAYTPDFETGWRFTFFRLTSDFKLSLIASDENNAMFFEQAWRGCVIPSPHDPNILILGDAFNDIFGYFNLTNHTFHQGSRPGGSCIFALGTDNDNVVWSGNYGTYFYYSTDGGITFSDAIVGQQQGFPEVWGMTQYRRTLYAVGCQPSSIIARNTTKHNPDSHLNHTWDVIYHGTSDGDGNGFMCCLPESSYGGRLIIGCGNEPFYYERSDAVGKVYAWDGVRLTDISQGLYWGNGVYMLAGSAGKLTSGPQQQQPVNFW